VADNAFSRSCRLLTASDYKTVFDKSQLKVSNRYFLVLATNNSLPTPRVGLVIAKKNVGKAVHRNRIKRLIRQSFRTQKSTLNNLDLVVLARKDADKLENQAIVDQLNQLWQDLAKKQARVSSTAKH
jgi:ribonuclease P protein component